jgi:hypothetical protein
MSLLVTINSTENVSPAKINDCIGTVNSALGLGTTGQRLVKSSGNDFDTVWANPENIAKYTGSAFALNTLVVGDAYNLTTTQNTFVGNANQLVKVYSLATPSKYFIGALESGTTTTNLAIRIHINSNIADATSISDWVIVPYNYVLSTDYDSGALSFGVTTNDVFSNIDAGGLSGVSGIEFQVQASKIGKQVTINGGFGILNSTQTLTDKKINAYIDLQSKYQHANQVGELSAINGIFPITGVVYTTSTTTINQILSGFAYFDTQNQLVLQLNGNNTIASSTDIYFYFNISYVASNYSE